MACTAVGLAVAWRGSSRSLGSGVRGGLAVVFAAAWRRLSRWHGGGLRGSLAAVFAAAWRGSWRQLGGGLGGDLRGSLGDQKKTAKQIRELANHTINYTILFWLPRPLKRSNRIVGDLVEIVRFSKLNTFKTSPTIRFDRFNGLGNQNRIV